MVDGVIQTKGMAVFGRELGVGELDEVVAVRTDSNAAKGFVSRRGLGRMKHIDVKHLWLQKEVAQGKVSVEKVPGKANVADIGTKYLTRGEIVERLGVVGLEMVWSAPGDVGIGAG